MHGTGSKMLTVRELTYIALMAVLIAVCSWLTVPAPVPFTMQTFGVFCSLELLGGRRGTLAVLVYILLGALGLPVFSGFTGGVGRLLGATGGYIAGFLLTALVYRLATALFGGRAFVRAAGMAVGLLTCYAAGTLWFMRVYAAGGGAVTLAGALGMCVLPFLIPDAIKLALAMTLARALRKHTAINTLTDGQQTFDRKTGE